MEGSNVQLRFCWSRCLGSAFSRHRHPPAPLGLPLAAFLQRHGTVPRRHTAAPHRGTVGEARCNGATHEHSVAAQCRSIMPPARFGSAIASTHFLFGFATLSRNSPPAVNY
jgi:hypothetical protein